MIKVQLDEYENLLNETYALHKESMKIINECIKDLEGMLEPGGGFHAELISEKVEMILEVVNGLLLSDLKSTFNETERQMFLLGQRLAEEDENRRLNVQWER